MCVEGGCNYVGNWSILRKFKIWENKVSYNIIRIAKISVTYFKIKVRVYVPNTVFDISPWLPFFGEFIIYHIYHNNLRWSKIIVQTIHETNFIITLHKERNLRTDIYLVCHTIHTFTISSTIPWYQPQKVLLVNMRKKTIVNLGK